MQRFITIRNVFCMASFTLLSMGINPGIMLAQEHSVAMQWNEVQLNCIRKDRPRPTVQARNLCHASIVMWDAWATYDDNSKPYFLGSTWGTFNCPFEGISMPEDVQAAREKAISYAMYRFLYHRYLTPPVIVPNSAGQQAAVAGYINGLMNELGYDPTITSTDYTDGDPAKLGNYIAMKMQEFALQDGSNQAAGPTGYANQYYVPANTEPLNPNFPGDPGLIYPNQWQPLCLGIACQQGTSIEQGNCVPEPVPCNAPALTPEFGNVVPFAMTDNDLTIIQRDGHEWKVYHDQGPPPILDPNSFGGLESFFKWGYAINIVWHSLHDPDNGTFIDISPNAIGNNQWYPEVGNFEQYQDFYDMFGGNDPGIGYNVNPATGLPYEEQWVPQGDYTRVLSEFWADGPNSETPPGHWFTILNSKVSNHPEFAKRWMGQGPILDDLEWDVRAYLVLGGGVMDAAIACWGAKGAYDYGRPIFTIRYMAERGQCSDPLQPNYHPEGLPLIPGFIEVVEEGDPLQGMNGEHIGKIKLYTWSGPPAATGSSGVEWILGENWWTYQSASFVTPPFPGYMSGHSTYSRTSAEILTAITGDEYFPGGFGEFHSPALTGLIAEVGPSQSIDLQWARYFDASDQCGLSRIFGGLHPPQDDIPGRHIGMILGPEVVDKANTYIEAAVPHASIQTSVNTITDNEVGTPFTVTIVFGQSMDIGFNPGISFLSTDPLSTLTQTNGIWTDIDTYVITYSVTDINETKNNIIWKITDAMGINGETMIPALSEIIGIDTKNPSVTDFNNNTFELINDNTALGGMLSAAIIFDEQMDMSYMPEVLFPEENPGESFTFNPTESYWLDNHIFLAMFDIIDNNSETENVDIEVINAVDATGNTQIDFHFDDYYDIDMKNPEVDMITVSDEEVSELNEGIPFIINIHFNEGMSGSYIPVVSFDPDLSTSLAVVTSGWIDDSTFSIEYDLTDVDQPQVNAGISVNAARDAMGNLQVPLNQDNIFVIDTQNPQVATVQVNDDLLSDSDVGAGQLHVSVVFDQQMGDIDPVIEFPEGGLGSSLNYASGNWINPFTFEAIYDVSDAGVEVADINAMISGAEDVSGNIQQSDFTETDLFSIDTKNPSVLILTANTYNITSANTGNGGFELITIFDEPMHAGIDPVFLFPEEDPSSVLTYSNGPSEWTNSTTFEAVYNVATDLVTIQDIDVSLTAATDAAGNELDPYYAEDFFDIHTIVSTGNLNELSEVKVYPNPVHNGDNLIVEWSEMKGDLKIVMYNMMGQEVSHSEIGNVVSGRYTFQTTDLSAGTYTLQLKTENGQLTFHVVVVK